MSSLVSGRRRWALPALGLLLAGAPAYPIVAMSLVNAFDQLDAQILGIVLPEVMADLHFDLGQVLWVSLPGGLIGICVALAGGYLGDRVNRVWLMVLGNLGFAVSGILTGLMPNFASFAVLRVLSTFTNINGPSQGPLIADLYPPAARGFAYGMWQNVKPIGAIVGSLAAGYLAVKYGWRWTYIIVGIPVLLAIASLLRIREPGRGRYDFDEASRAYASVIQVGPLQTFRVLVNIRSYVRILAGFAVIGLGTTVLLVQAVYYYAVFGIDPVGRGVIGALTAAVGLVFGIVGGIYLQRRRPRIWPLATGAGLVLIAAGCVVMALAPTVQVAVLAALFNTAVFGLINTGIFLQMVATVPPHMRAMAFAIATLPSVLGGLWLPVVNELSLTHGYRVAILASSLWYVVAGLIIGDGARHIERDAERAEHVLQAEADARQRRAHGEAVDLLEVHGLDVAYGTVQVLFGIDMRVAEGELVALLGTNGAGKSTLLRTVSGLLRPLNGTVLYNGSEVTGMDAEALAARGIIHVPGGRGVFPGLSVERHLRLATYLYRHDPGQRKATMQQVLDIFPVLAARLDQAAGTMSGGEQQMLNLAQAMMMRPRLLLIDELSLGLAPKVVEELLQIVEEIHRSGVTVVLVEQSVNIALDLAERAYFLEKGEVRFQGRSSELADREDLVRSVFLAGAR